jgi:hypothetical protein
MHALLKFLYIKLFQLLKVILKNLTMIHLVKV